jgi:hypothetical protein
MNGPPSVAEYRLDNELLIEVERLLLQYPDVSERELDRITAFLRDGTILEIGLLSTNKPAWRNAESIRAKYPQKFARTRQDYLALGTVLGGMFLIFLIFWFVAVGRG